MIIIDNSINVVLDTSISTDAKAETRNMDDRPAHARYTWNYGIQKRTK